MSRQAVKKVAFLAKAPSNRHELRRILDLAGRLMAQDAKPGRDETESDPRVPDNVIPFPER